MRTKLYNTEDFLSMLRKAYVLSMSGFEYVNDHVIITDNDGVILYANKAAEDKTGFTRGEMTGKTPGELWGNMMEKKFYQDMWHTIKIEKKNFAGTVLNKRKDGSLYYAELRIYPILDESGETLFFMSIEPDITERIEEERKKDAFLSSAAHQVKSPLAAVRLLLETLKAKSDLSTENLEIVKQIKETNKNLADFIEDFLIISRIEGGALISEKQGRSLTDFLTNIIVEIKPLADKKNIILDFEYQEHFPVRAHFPVLRQIFQNLILNAINYSFEKGRITISLARRGTDILFSCKDEGIGISKKEQANLFKPFFRAENAISHTGGTGLGLFIVKKLADEFGYKIWLESKENKGTTAHLTVPVN